MATKFAFFAQTTASFLQKFDHNTVFREKRHFSPKNWQKLHKIESPCSVSFF
jgi:hypothetical protein